ASFSDLPVYSNGKLINYSVQELEVANYVSVVSSDADYAFTVVNSHVPVVTDVSVAKVWDDNNDQDGLRPVEVSVVLLADSNVVGTVTLNANNGWKASFSDLPVYSNGKLIKYSVQELEVPGYTSTVSSDDDYSFIVNNTHAPLVTDVNVAKVWDDNNNQDGVRPVEVSVVLLGDGNVVGTVTLNANNGWKASFSDLPVYSNGKLIKYSVQELEVANYVSVVSSDAEYDFTVVNTHVPEVTVVNVTKVWKGVDDKDKKPVEVILYADGVKVSNITLYPGNNWKFSFEDLPIYKDGKKINYTIGIDGADNYTVDITEENGNFTITTTVVPEEDENITDETEEIDEVDDSDDETPTPQPSVPHKHHVSKHVKPDKNATGNPIALLLLALFIPLIRRKQN
ncbi:MAG: Cna B-type domain-containing protein, partial [Methanobrevibacter sp.]|nr:Cna B-type domain-containing protein [Methanobrevibacter sp.]